MATTVDICNLALSALGDEAGVTSIDPADGSDQAGHCARWYPIALRRLLESANWSFATKSAELSQLSNASASLYGHKYAFALPSQCLRPIKIDSLEWLTEATEHYVRELPPSSSRFQLAVTDSTAGRVLFCDIADPVLTYVAYCETAELFPGYFIDALVLLLASYLYGPVKRSDVTSNTALALLKQYEFALIKAKNEDAQLSLRRPGVEYVASQLRAREV